jgi:hypothetical protein
MLVVRGREYIQLHDLFSGDTVVVPRNGVPEVEC